MFANTRKSTQDSPSALAARSPLENGTNTRRDRGIALVLFGVVFAVYASTLCPSIYTGDDGDFITAMTTFGVPHPTGYPLFCLLGRLFLTIIPWGNPAFKINLMTALLGAASIGFLYRFLALTLAPRGHRYLAATGALLFAFAPTMWQQSLSCEVYSLTSLFLTSLLYLAARWQQEPGSSRALLWLTFAFGLSLTNHLTLALLLPVFLAFVIYHRPTLFGREWKLLPLMAVLFVLPLSLYLYLPLAARNTSAPVNWGLPNTWLGFYEHVTGDAFRPLMFQSVEIALRQATEYVGYLTNEFGIPLLLLVPIGVYLLCRGETSEPARQTASGLRKPVPQTRTLCGLLLAVWGITAFYAFNYEIFDIYVYYIPSYMVASCLIAFGMSGVITGFQNWRQVPTSERARVAPLVALIALMIPVVPMSLNYESSSKSGNYLEDDFTHNILQSSPKNALIITSSNVTLSLWYRRFVLRERQDAVPIHQGMMGGLTYWNGWYAKHLYRMYPDIAQTYPENNPATVVDIAKGRFLIKMMRRAVERGVPVIIVPDPRFDREQEITKSANTTLEPFDDKVAEAGMVRVPWGVCDRVYLQGQEPDATQVVSENLKLRPLFRFRGVYDHTWAFADPMQRHIPRCYLNADEALAKTAEQAKRYDIAIEALERALLLNDLPELRAAKERCAAQAGK